MIEGSIVCTLFEGSYHFGVAGLTNSLYKHGYRGCIYAGYRGNLPFWVKSSRKQDILGVNGFVMEVAERLELRFIPLDTDYHLTNYKPDFMLRVWSAHKETSGGIFYFDPDIVLVQNWVHLENWITCGVAVSEDVNSPLQEYHPRRCAWREYFNIHGITLQFKNSIYVNGGFLGVSKKDIAFLYLWKTVQEVMSLKIGGLNRSAFRTSDQLEKANSGDFAPFGKTDQDALNAALEAYTSPISFGGKEVMGFGDGLVIIPHALGRNKPWTMRPVRDWFRGKSPRLVDKVFVQMSDGPVLFYSKFKRARLSFSIHLVSFLSRFYSK